MTTVDLEQLSLEWERESGYDSIPTIKRVYDTTPSGAYKCMFPDCDVARKDAAVLWRHIHTAHGKNTLPPALVAHEAKVKVDTTFYGLRESDA